MEEKPTLPSQRVYLRNTEKCLYVSFLWLSKTSSSVITNYSISGITPLMCFRLWIILRYPSLMILDSKKKKKTIQNKRLQFPENNKLKGGMAKVGTIANLGYHCKPLLWKALALRERQKRP